MNDIYKCEFTDGLFKGISIELNTKDIHYSKGNVVLSNSSIIYDENNQIIKDYGKDNFLKEAREILLKIIYMEMER